MNLLLTALLTTVGTGEAPTFSKDVAPILFANCVTCHRPGAIGPFNLTTYAEARKRSKLIARVATDKTMPPWKPEDGHGEFLDTRTLTVAQIATLKMWAEAGAPEGDPKQTPKLPVFKTGWQIGKPDIILKMPKAFTAPAEGRDIYMHFVFPLDIKSDIYVKAVEVRPGNLKVAHHAIGLLDSSGTARKKADPKTGGYVGFGGPGFVPSGFTPGFVPGATPRAFEPGSAITLKKGTDFVLQMHYHPTGKAEVDQTEVGLYLTKEKPTKHMLGVLMGSLEIDIKPGDANYVCTDKFVLPVALKVGSIWAHMHLIGKDVKVWAELPEGKTVKLLRIGDWDFNWQDTYLYKEPVTLPRGTVIKTEWRFDNTNANPRNPNNPPKRVLNGEGSTDEMGGVWIGGEVATEGDMWSLLLANVGHYIEVESKKKAK
ncbi:MAG: ascorbate-dependent monooxygenase [Planctomycetaceae bacterium]|nr:ascorbate-dependent monooxygenase [Planctomycetaceae bacterium]